MSSPPCPERHVQTVMSDSLPRLPGLRHKVIVATKALLGSLLGNEIAANDRAGDVARRDRPAEQEALRLLAAHGAYQFELRAGLNPFGDCRHVQASAQIRNRAHDREAIRFLVQILHKGAI